jgi:hypothetical protein
MKWSTSYPDNPRPIGWLIQVAAGLLVGWMLFFTRWEDGWLRFAASAVIVLALWPMSRWVQRRDDRYPLVETILAVTLPFFALPLLIEHRLLLTVPEDLLAQALVMVLVFQVSLIAGAAAAPRHHRSLRSPVWTEPIIPEDRLHVVGHGMLLNTLWLFVATFTTWVPMELQGTFRALFFGIGLISAFTLARLWAQRLLRPAQKLAMVANLIAQLALIATSLLLIHAMTLVGVVVLGYFSSSRRIPWTLILPALVIFTILHHGKASMRQMYWEEGRPELQPAALPAFFAEWFDVGLHHLRQPDQGGKLLLLERSSLLQVAAFVVAQVPDRVAPFDGESYRTIPLQVVPRFFWPDKPSPTDSVSLLSVELGILSRDQAESTSIAFGMITESYANFQLAGPLVLGLILGFGLHWVALTTAGAAVFSFHGLLRILVLAWCLNAEVTAALWISSLYQACIAVFLPLYAWRFLSRR